MSRDNLRYDSPAFTLATHFFRQYLVAHDLTTKDAEGVTLQLVYNWLHENPPDYSERLELQEQYGLDESELDFLDAVISDPFEFMHAFYTFWPLLALAYRPSPKDRPTSFAITFDLCWPDKRITIPVAHQVAKDMPLDGYIVTAWRRVIEEQTVLLAQLGGVEGLLAAGNHTNEQRAIRPDAEPGPYLRELTEEEQEAFDSGNLPATNTIIFSSLNADENTPSRDEVVAEILRDCLEQAVQDLNEEEIWSNDPWSDGEDYEEECCEEDEYDDEDDDYDEDYDDEEDDYTACDTADELLGELFCAETGLELDDFDEDTVYLDWLLRGAMSGDAEDKVPPDVSDQKDTGAHLRDEEEDDASEE